MREARGDPSRRALWLLAGAGVWIVILLVRLVDLQIVRRDEFIRRARKQQERTVELPPRRGEIRDRDDKPLAVTMLVDSVFAIPSDVTDPRRTALLLAPILNQSARELAKKLGSGDRDFVWLARRIPESASARLRPLLFEHRVTGVRLQPEPTRRYPEGRLAAAVLGYVGTDNQGLAGLEYRYDGEVRGRPARVTLLRDAAQRLYETRRRDGDADGVEGATLVLTLSSKIQHAVERELFRAAEESRARSASAVVLDPKSGAVLALASYPTFDPNRFADSDAEARRCRPLADAYEPGSTFKVITASAALDAGAIGIDDLIDCGGGAMTIGGTTIHEHDGRAWSVLTLADVLARSSNIGIAHVGLALGRGPFYRAVRAFGFGQRSGIELDGESSGLLSEPSGWSALTLPTMSFGQEIGVTVLQMARAYAAVANDGLLPTPHLVETIQRPGEPIRRLPPPPPSRVMSERTARTLRRLLERAVDMGTGKLAAIPGYTSAGKTGTAQKAIPGGGYSRERHVASFIGFTPAERPRIVIAVVLDEPKGKYYGGDVAAPVFASIGAETLRILREPPTEAPSGPLPAILTADLSAGAAASAPLLSGDLVPVARHVGGRDDEEGDRVPDVGGKSARDAIRILAARGLMARLSGSGFVFAQDPPAGTLVRRAASCALVLSTEPPSPRDAPLPAEGGGIERGESP